LQEAKRRRLKLDLLLKQCFFQTTNKNTNIEFHQLSSVVHLLMQRQLRRISCLKA